MAFELVAVIAVKMYAEDILIIEPATLEEALVAVRRIAGKMYDDIFLRGNQLTPPLFSARELVEQMDMWCGVLDQLDSELSEDNRLKALNTLKYMVRYQTLHPYMEPIMDFMEYRHIKQFVSIWS